jgi:hypothetical protein
MAVTLLVRHRAMSGPACHSCISRQFMQKLGARGDGVLPPAARRSPPISYRPHILCANPGAPHATLATP